MARELPAGASQLAVAENTAEVEEGLRMILEEISFNVSPHFEVYTYEERLMMTMDNGLTLKLNNGAEFTLNVGVYSNPDVDKVRDQGA